MLLVTLLLINMLIAMMFVVFGLLKLSQDEHVHGDLVELAGVAASMGSHYSHDGNELHPRGKASTPERLLDPNGRRETNWSPSQDAPLGYLSHAEACFRKRNKARKRR